MNNIEKSLEEFDIIERAPITLIRESADNFVYRVGESHKVILRISKRLPIEDVQFEYEAVKHISDAGVPVAPWLLTKAGAPYVLINGAVAVLNGFIEGDHVMVDANNLPTKAQAYSAGMALGSMNNASSDFHSSSARKRNIFHELQRAVSLKEKFQREFEGGDEFIKQVESAIRFAETGKEVEGFIHNDYRPGNVLFGNGGSVAGIIDFDWGCFGPIIKDVALALMEWSFPDGATKIEWSVFDAFLEGYNAISNQKIAKGARLYEWIAFAALSDAATYFCDLAFDPNSNKRVIRSYMYKKFLFFSGMIK